MKKKVLFILPIFLLTSCNKVEYLDLTELLKEIDNKIYDDYIANNVINTYDNYESYKEFAVNNFSEYSFYTLNSKDATKVWSAAFNPIFRVAYNDYTLPYETTTPINVICGIHFMESYLITNKELDKLDGSTISKSDKDEETDTHSIFIQSVFYPTSYDEKDYNLEINYTQKYMRIKVEGKYSTLGYIYASGRIDSSVYKDIIINYVNSNLEYHVKDK